jgi:hypothetical protein
MALNCPFIETGYRKRLVFARSTSSWLLGVAERPNSREIAGRARDAAAAFLQLHPLPHDEQAVS